MKLCSWLIFAILLCSATINAAEVYRWTDDNGNVIFGDKPPKNKAATSVHIEHNKKSGTQFADPAQIKNFERGATKTQQRKSTPKKRIDADCRRYISQLNKVEIFLEHSNSPRDQLKARDLRKLAKNNCGDTRLTQKFSDSYCHNYRKKLEKISIFLEHTSTPLDEQKVKDLRKQIARECE